MKTKAICYRPNDKDNLLNVPNSLNLGQIEVNNKEIRIETFDNKVVGFAYVFKHKDQLTTVIEYKDDIELNEYDIILDFEIKDRKYISKKIYLTHKKFYNMTL